MRLLTYNVHSGVGSDGRYDPERIARVAAATGADVVALQEVEANEKMATCRCWSREHADNQPQMVATACGLPHVRFFATLRASLCATDGRGEVLQWEGADSATAGGYGNALISRYPVLDYRELRYSPAPARGARVDMHGAEQPRGAMACLLDAPEGRVWVVNTHSSHKSWAAEHRRQARQCAAWAEQLAEEVGSCCVLCGDLNAPPWLPHGWHHLITRAPGWRDLWSEGAAPGAPHATCPSMAYATGLSWGAWLLTLWRHRIDHVLAFEPHASRERTGVRCRAMSVVCEGNDAIHASDHCAVVAEIGASSFSWR